MDVYYKLQAIQFNKTIILKLRINYLHECVEKFNR